MSFNAKCIKASVFRDAELKPGICLLNLVWNRFIFRLCLSVHHQELLYLCSCFLLISCQETENLHRIKKIKFERSQLCPVSSCSCCHSNICSRKKTHKTFIQNLFVFTNMLLHHFRIKADRVSVLWTQVGSTGLLVLFGSDGPALHCHWGGKFESSTNKNTTPVTF